MRKRKLEFRVSQRYGYSAVDVIDEKSGAVLTTAIAGVTRKEAEIISGAMENVQGSYYQRLAESALSIMERQNEEKKLKKAGL
jgi:hypothetical protein